MGAELFVLSLPFAFLYPVPRISDLSLISDRNEMIIVSIELSQDISRASAALLRTSMNGLYGFLIKKFRIHFSECHCIVITR